MNKILELYEEMRFDISSDVDYIENHTENYSNIKKYFAGKLTLEDLLKGLNGCPPEADCKNNGKTNVEKRKQYKDCWERCINEEVID